MEKKPEDLCPYCNERKKIRATCGHWECQFKNKAKITKEWWKKNGKIYQGSR